MGGIPAAAFVASRTADEEQRWADSMLLSAVVEPVVRVWSCVQPAVILGRGQRPDESMLLRATSDGVELCRRATGGGAVLAGPWLLSASVILPSAHPFVSPHITESFRWFGQAHADWLNAIGICASCVAPEKVRLDLDLAWACFGNLSHWEVEVGGRKIAGLSQARTRNGVQLSSGVLIGTPPWTLLCDVLGRANDDAAELARRTASCAQLLCNPAPVAAMASSLLQAVSQKLAI